jgi:CHAD domain-containing protein
MVTSPSDHLEVEWQFDAPDLARVSGWLEVARVPGYTVTAGATKRIRDTYFDTADWRLSRGRFTCRVRDKADGAEVTLKSTAPQAGGMRTRRERNDRLGPGETLPGRVAAAATAGEAALPAIRLVAGARHLAPLFTLAQERRQFLLADLTGHLGEISVDATEVEGTAGRLQRVEVEVPGDSVDRAGRFVELMIATCGLTPGTVSKYEAGLAASGLATTPTESTLGSTTVAGAMTAGEVAFSVMRRHFATFLANEPGTRLGEDIEALHDMRVAARRLRAAMQAFRPWLPARIERYRLELGRIAAALGEVRDLDVQLERLAEWRAEDPAQAHALDAVEALLNERRDAGRRRMLAVLDQRRYDILVERFAAVLRNGPPRSFAAGHAPILEVAPLLLRKRYRRFRQLGDSITRSSPAAEYHALRIDGKRLRYALEFVGPIYGKPATDFATRLTALQDILGLHQDAEIAIDMLQALAAANARRLGPEAILAMGAIQERYRRHAVELRGQFPAAYRPVRKDWARLVKVMR